MNAVKVLHSIYQQIRKTQQWWTDSFEKTLILWKIEGRRRTGWDGWMSSLTQWAGVWVNSRSWWWRGRPGMLQSMKLQKLDMTNLLNWTQLSSHYEEQYGDSLKKLEIELPYKPAVPLLGIHTEETRIERHTCTPVFITALFTIARTWKQPRFPLAVEWIIKLWYICTMEYYWIIEKNAFESALMRWIKLEPIIQSEVSQKEKHQYSILMHIYGI